MSKTLLVAFGFALALANACLAADDPVLDIYHETLLRVRHDAADPTAMMGARPPVDPKNPAHREILNQLVSHLEEQAKKAPGNFDLIHNYYLALWLRYIQLGNAEDATAAFVQLERADKLTEPASDAHARCGFERADGARAILAEKEVSLAVLQRDFEGKTRQLADAENEAKARPDKRGLAEEIQRLREETKRIEADAARLKEGIPRLRDECIERFLSAKRNAMSKGYYGARSALALANLYFAKSDADSAKKAIREAMELDTERGYVTNYGYDLLGRVLLTEGNLDEAVTMLEAAGRLKPDEDLKRIGYAYELATLLIEGGRSAAAVDYLQKAVNETDAEHYIDLVSEEHVASEKDKRDALAKDPKSPPLLTEKDIPSPLNPALRPGLFYALASGYTALDKSGPALMYWRCYLAMRDENEARRQKAKETAFNLAVKTSGTKP